MAIFEAYDPGRVAAVAASLGEEVLSSGRAIGEATASGYELVLALCAVGYVIGMLAAFATYRLSSARTDDILVLGGMLGGALLTVSALAIGWTLVPFADVASNRGYVITKQRLVLLDSGDRRTDVPASEILTLKRTGKAVVISRTNAPDVVIQVPGSELDRAEAFYGKMTSLRGERVLASAARR